MDRGHEGRTAIPRLEGFSDLEAVEAVKVLRVCVERMDSHIGGALDPVAAAGALTSSLDVPKRLNSDVRLQLAKRLTGRAKQAYGINMTPAEALKIVKQRIG